MVNGSSGLITDYWLLVTDAIISECIPAGNSTFILCALFSTLYSLLSTLDFFPPDYRLATSDCREAAKTDY